MNEEEKILGTIPGIYLKGGFFKNKNCTLVVTNKRIIMAEVTKNLLKEEKRRKREELKKEGKGRIKQFLSSLSIYTYFHKRYLNMNPDVIVKESPGNFFLTLDDIKRIKLKRGKVTYDDEGDEFQEPHLLIIVSSSKKEFKFNFSADFNSTKRLLSQFYGRTL